MTANLAKHPGSLIRAIEAEAKDDGLRDLLHNAQWAIELLAKHAKPYNHEYTCIVRLTQAIGAVERREG